MIKNLGSAAGILRSLLICILAGSLLAACATVPTKGTLEYDEYKQRNDPLEPMNKGVLSFNMALDKVIVRPITKTYLKVVPEPARKGMTNFLDNLLHPWYAVNALLQGKIDKFGTSLGRFVINSTIGIGGLGDPATKMKIERHKEDLGQTLAVWGIPSGPYLMLPFFGPSNFRDTVGFTGEFFFDPMGIAIDKANVANIGNSDISALSVARLSMDSLDWRARNDVLFDELHDSADPYSMARSAYRQLRNFEISDGKEVSTEEEEDMFGEDIE